MHAVSPSTAKADAINDNRFIVVTVLMVIWDYSHQKEFVTFNAQMPRFSQTFCTFAADF